MAIGKRHILALAAGAFALAAMPALAETVGVTDKEIKIGNINPYSGPASAYGTIGKTIEAYFKKINEEGGINGRKINFITYDDAYSPPKAVEQARKLVESDQVAFIFQSLGTPSNSAIHKYMNSKKVPQLFVATGATKWDDPKDNPWTMGWQPNYQTEGKIYAKYILENYANGKIGVLFQNDDYGKDLLKGLKDGLGAKASMIISEVPYEVSVPTIDPQIVQLKGVRRRRSRHYRHAEIRCSGHSQGRRARLEADAFRKQRLNFRRQRAEAGGLGECQGHSVHRLPQGSNRSGRQGRSGIQGMGCLHGQVLS